MSRIGKNPVAIPDGVSVNIVGPLVTAKGKLGELSAQFTDDVEVTQEDNLVYVKPRNTSREARKMWGTSKSIISNLVVGVSEGFTRKLEINGVGYRAQVQGKTLNLQLGFSHDVNYPIPEGIEIKCADQTQIEIFGANKQLWCQCMYLMTCIYGGALRPPIINGVYQYRRIEILVLFQQHFNVFRPRDHARSIPPAPPMEGRWLRKTGRPQGGANFDFFF